MEGRLTQEFNKSLHEMEDRIIRAIQKSDHDHTIVHDEMRRAAEARHQPITAFLEAQRIESEQEEIERARKAGVRTIFTGAWRVVVVLDQHWRIVAVIAAAVLALLGNVHLSFTGN